MAQIIPRSRLIYHNEWHRNERVADWFRYSLSCDLQYIVDHCTKTDLHVAISLLESSNRLDIVAIQIGVHNDLKIEANELHHLGYEWGSQLRGGTAITGVMRDWVKMEEYKNMKDQNGRPLSKRPSTLGAIRVLF